MTIYKKSKRLGPVDPYAYDAGNLTIEDVSMEFINKSNNPVFGPPQIYYLKSTREHERLEWLQFECHPGEKVELPHGRYRVITDDGKPTRGCDIAYGKDKTRHKLAAQLKQN